jgi:hypothetical protein
VARKKFEARLLSKRVGSAQGFRWDGQWSLSGLWLLSGSGIWGVGLERDEQKVSVVRGCVDRKKG